MMKKIYKIYTIFLLLISSCHVPPSQTDSSLSKSFTPPHGKSFIYVYRPFKFVGAADKVRISMNNRFKGELSNGQFICLQTPPGKHQIIVGSKLLSFQTHPGSSIFIETEAELHDTKGIFVVGQPNIPIATFKFNAITTSPHIAKNEIMKCKEIATVDIPTNRDLIVKE